MSDDELMMRDHFAAMALLMRHLETYLDKERGVMVETDPAVLAARAYAIADAMLAERAK